MMRQRRSSSFSFRSSTPLLALSLALGCGLMSPEDQSGAPAPARQSFPPAGYVLAFQDEFDGSSLDTSRWTPYSGERLDSLATPDAVDVQGGILTLLTYTEGGVNRTGFLSTAGNFQALYGYFAARIRFHDAPGSWCAFWLLPPSVGNPLGDPGTAGTEIDVVEHRVTDPGGWTALADMVAMNVNWDGYDQNKKTVQKVMALPDGSPVQGAWHTYGVLWNEVGYTFYVDEVPLWSTATAVSHHPEYVLLTCEVADASWAGYVPAGGYGQRATSTTGMEVDWVRAWQPAR